MVKPVTIVGAGIVGICCALSLRDRGLPVRLIDRGEPGQETSFGNAGIISPWSIIPQAMPGIWKSLPRLLMDPGSPLSVRMVAWPAMIPWGIRFLRRANENSLRAASDAMEMLCAPSIELYQRHLAGTGCEDLITDSYYVHAVRDEKNARLDTIDYRLRREKGAEIERIGATELHALEPALAPEFKAAILVKGQARARSPGLIATVLADKARASGAEIVKAELTAIRRDPAGGWALYMQDGVLLKADRIVLAAGIWSGKLLEPLGIKLPMVAERGYHVQFPDPQVDLNHSVMDVEAKVVASTMLEGLRVAGTAEFGPVDAAPDPRKTARLIAQSRAICPDLRTSHATSWMGRRPSLPDSLPVIGEITGQEGLFAAFGHSHYGLMMAPKTGEVIADLLSNRSSNRDLAMFSEKRFG